MHLSYAGNSFRFKQVGAIRWYVAIDVAKALELGNARSMMGLLSDGSRLTLRFGRRDYQAISPDDVLRLCLIAPTKNATALSAWLTEVDSQLTKQGLPVYVREECHDLVQDYVSRCRRSLIEAGAQAVELDVSMANQIADKVASAVIRHRRWLMSLSGDGTPVLTPIPGDSMAFNLDHLVKWIRDHDGATPAQVMQINAAVMERVNRNISYLDRAV
ncbi:toxin-antitoxin system, toxin component, Bro family [Pseudomonas sp. StFLB209]|nr:toxin-antitoxin system, toxin component, Bro family [Pseudomonas sp. StFLB209]